jgi:hypothetical protein
MGEQEHYPTAFLPITQRIRAAFATILDEEKPGPRRRAYLPTSFWRGH